MGDTSLGFIGAGFVGGAMIRAFSGYAPITIYDKGLNIGTLNSVIRNSDMVFLSLPTPEKANGACDTSIIESVMDEIDLMLDIYEEPEPMPVVIRSTTDPNWFSCADNKYRHIDLMFMPEFLTARSADLDFIMSSRFIFGVGDPEFPTEGQRLVQTVFENRFPRTRQVVMSWEEAALVKYATNNFFCVKISFFNELFDVCEALGVNGTNVIEEVMNDGRIGRSHFKVPGPDGKRGYGGACFPKDSAAFAKISDPNNTMVTAAREVNRRVRGDK